MILQDAMHSEFAPPPLDDGDVLRPPADASSRRALVASFVAMALLCLIGAWLVHSLDPAPGAALDGATDAARGFWILAGASLLCLLLRTAWMPVALTALMAAATLAIAGSALALGWGLASPGLFLPGAMICVLAGVVGWQAGVLLALVAVICLLAVNAAAPGLAGLGHPAADAAVLLSTRLTAVGAGLLGGLAIALVARRQAGAEASNRELRYRGLLALAADAYWELDAAYRIVAAVYHADRSRTLGSAGGLGSVPWELDRFACDADTLDQLQADLDARQPFRDLPVSWRDGDGRLLRFLISGAPRFRGDGVFIGYWGVARDVTADREAREALAATETRYQELFTRIPTPLALHRGGRVIDANPAALALFGHSDLSILLGRDLLQQYESGDSRERERRRIEELELQPVGSALPVTDFRLLARGRKLWVRATGVRVEADSGPATLAIYIDDTERLAAEEAVRRSEAMLSHLVATSPDLITLTDMATGRFVMVNDAFQRVIGYSAQDAVGRTSLELGVWQSAEARERFMHIMQTQGAVSNLAVTFIAANGKPVALLVSAARFVMDSRDYVVINARDVTQSERARLEREAILDNASVGIAVTRERHFVLANRHFETLFGWAPGDIVGQSGEVVWLDAADYTAVADEVVPVLLRGDSVVLERPARRRDGSVFLARVQGRAIDPAHPNDSGTVWIVEDITERHQFEQTLARARDDAEAANRAKSAFLANTSHELRTPLNGMIGLARLAREPDLPEARRVKYLDQIADSAQALGGIITDILDLSKIEAGKLDLETTDFDLGELMRSLHQAYATLAAEHGLTLELELADNARGTVSGDPLRVRQIVTNYLSNALKFTARGAVKLRAQRLDGADGGPSARLLFEVEDSGSGIEPQVLARLFKPFTQADESTTRRFGGTGLGLSICHELASLMGGEVGVHSQPGVGSLFWAELPLPAAPQTQPAPLAEAAAPIAGARVLLVEDNPVNMMIAAAMLERWGVHVEQAADGRQALDAVQRAADHGRRFDAVLMDVQMPVMSGHEATRELRASPAGRHLPIIALTAAALVSERDQAMQAGMNDFLTKPIDADRLRAALARWAPQDSVH